MVAILLLVVGIVLVVAGAELFFDGLLAAAARLGVSAFVLTVVLSGFELENLAAGIAANARGLGNAAAGTFLGGTTFLALAVPGAAALVAPIRASLSRSALAWTAASPLPLLAFGVDGDLQRWEGGVLVAWFVVAIVGIARSGAPAEESRVEREGFALARVVLGLAVLAAAGDLLTRGIRDVVRGFGIPQSLLGNTAIAASVEGEEIARVVVPSRLGRGDMALGNVIGTIAHFAAFNAGVIALVRPIDLDQASRVLHLPAAAASPAFLAAVVAVTGTVGRRTGALLVAVYAAYVAGAVILAL